VTTSSALGQGTTFTYQGRLASSGVPVNGLIDFRVRVYDAVTNGNQFGSTFTTNSVVVTNGSFALALDFGSVFTGPNRWLEIAAKTNGSSTFTNLNPRQPLTPTPYAITASGTPAGAINSTMLASGAVTTDKIAVNAVKVNQIDDGGTAAYEAFQRTAQAAGDAAAVSFAEMANVTATNGVPPSLAFSTGGISFGTVVGFSGSEGMSRPFSYIVNVQYSGVAVDPSTKIGTTGILTYTRNGRSTSFSGVVTSCTLSGSTSIGLLYTFTLEPQVASLRHSTDYRVYQDYRVSDVISALTSSIGATSTFQLVSSYSIHATLTLYGETSLNFFHRLLELEGIFYYFDHGDSPPSLIFGDSTTAVQSPPGNAYLYYGNNFTNFAPGGNEVIRRFEQAAHLTTLSSVVKTYNFITPGTTLSATSSGSSGTGTNYSFGTDIKTSAYVNATANWQKQRETLESELISGSSTIPDLHAGYTFTLSDQTSAGLGGTYLVTSVQHAAFVRVTNGTSTIFYGNRFEAIPSSMVYRPAAVTPRPIAQPCTGVVVGPCGQPIYVDTYGRVKVQLHWDRYGAKNDTASAWMRVAVPMAGTNRALMFLPHVGEEVLVSFLQGDPDQPVVTGSFFNGAMTPPYSMPANQTVSTLRTVGADGLVNELKFDDTTGLQKISLTGARDVSIQASGKTSISTLGNLQSGQAIAGTSTSNSVIVSITFPKAFTSTPKIVVTPNCDPGWNVGDTFTTTIRSVTTAGCVVNVYRADSSGGWSQALRLNWIAWE
jgi:type VI secretion system secreted protein VgrG